MNVSDALTQGVPVNTARTAANNSGTPQRTEQVQQQADLSGKTKERSGIEKPDKDVRTEPETREEKEERRLAALARREEERENVIAVSEDGDTLQVEKDNADIIDEEVGGVVMRSQTRNEDDAAVAEGEAEAQVQSQTQTQNQTQQVQYGSEAFETAVYSREQGAYESSQSQNLTAEETAQEDLEVRQDSLASDIVERQALSRQEETERVADEAAEKEQNKASEAAEEQAKPQTSANFAGISDDRLEQMYLKGEISRYAYDNEMEAREAEREEQNEDNSAVSAQMNALETAERKVENDAKAIREATAEEASDTLNARQRLDIIEGLQQNNTEQRREEEQANVWQSQFLA